MSSVVENFVTSLKTKQLSEYDLIELAEKIDECASIYKYNDNKDEIRLLRMLYNKMTIWYNSQVKFKGFKENLK